MLWLHSVCGNSSEGIPSNLQACLLQKDDERRAQLTGGFHQAGGLTIFPRLRVTSTPNTEERPAGFPDFGIGVFSWPEIDRATPRELAFNRAVRHQAVDLSDQDDVHQASDFDPKQHRGANDSLSYNPRSAGPQFLSVTFNQSFFGYGGPRPNAFTVCFGWYLLKARPVRVEDVFDQGSGWQTFLGRHVYARVIASADIRQSFYPEAQGRPAAAQAVLDPEHWTRGRQRLEITLPAYSV